MLWNFITRKQKNYHLMRFIYFTDLIKKDKYCKILLHKITSWETISFLVYSMYTHCILLEKYNYRLLFCNLFIKTCPIISKYNLEVDTTSFRKSLRFNQLSYSFEWRFTRWVNKIFKVRRTYLQVFILLTGFCKFQDEFKRYRYRFPHLQISIYKIRNSLRLNKTVVQSNLNVRFKGFWSTPTAIDTCREITF